MNVRISTEQGLAWITFGTGDRANALTTTVRVELLEALGQVASDSEVRAVVLEGAGEHFCAGQDLQQHHATLSTDPGSISGMVRREFSPIITTVATMPKPVIACLNGAVMGAGLGLALACDLRISSTTAKFGTAFARVGLGPDSGVSWFLPRLVGTSRAVDLLLRPRIFPAPEALEMQLLHEVVAPELLTDRVQHIARDLASGPTVAYGAIKATLAASHGTLETSLDAEGFWQSVASRTHDHQDAVAAFVERKTPQYLGR